MYYYVLLWQFVWSFYLALKMYWESWNAYCLTSPNSRNDQNILAVVFAVSCSRNWQEYVSKSLYNRNMMAVIALKFSRCFSTRNWISFKDFITACKSSSTLAIAEDISCCCKLCMWRLSLGLNRFCPTPVCFLVKGTYLLAWKRIFSHGSFCPGALSSSTTSFLAHVRQLGLLHWWCNYL